MCVSTTLRKGARTPQPTYAWVIKLDDSSTVDQALVTPAERGSGRPVYYSRSGIPFDYSVIEHADVFGSKKDATFWARNSEEGPNMHVVRVRVSVEEVEDETRGAKLAAEIRAECNKLTPKQRKEAHAHGMALIHKGAGAKRAKGRVAR